MLKLLSSLVLVLLLSTPVWATCLDGTQVNEALASMRIPEKDRSILFGKFMSHIQEFKSVDCSIYFREGWMVSGPDTIFTAIGVKTEEGFTDIGIVVAKVRGDSIEGIIEIHLIGGFVYIADKGEPI